MFLVFWGLVVEIQKTKTQTRRRKRRHNYIGAIHKQRHLEFVALAFKNQFFLDPTLFMDASLVEKPMENMQMKIEKKHRSM